MCRKTVARRHSKMLPKSTDLDRVLHRDDDLYDLQGAKDEADKIAAQRPSTAGAALDYFGGEAEPATIEREPADEPKDKPAPKPRPEPEDEPRPAAEAAPGPPRTADEYKAFARTVIEDANKPAELDAWVNSPGQKRLRAACNVTLAEVDEIIAWIEARKTEAS